MTEEHYTLLKTADGMFHLYWSDKHSEHKIGDYYKEPDAINAMNKYVRERKSKIVTQTYMFNKYGEPVGPG